MLFLLLLLNPRKLINFVARFFVTRALLAASSHEEVMQILFDKGTGVGDGFSVNICYIKKDNVSEKPTMYNIEVAPPKNNQISGLEPKSLVSVRRVPPGEIYVHCNKLESVFFFALMAMGCDFND